MTTLTTSHDMRQSASDLRRAAQKLTEAADAIDRQKPTKRMAQLRAFIDRNGPSLRREIANGSGVPPGTISYLLKAKNGFKRDSTGRWTYKK